MVQVLSGRLWCHVLTRIFVLKYQYFAVKEKQTTCQDKEQMRYLHPITWFWHHTCLVLTSFDITNFCSDVFWHDTCLVLTYLSCSDVRRLVVRYVVLWCLFCISVLLLSYLCLVFVSVFSLPCLVWCRLALSCLGVSCLFLCLALSFVSVLSLVLSYVLSISCLRLVCCKTQDLVRVRIRVRVRVRGLQLYLPFSINLRRMKDITQFLTLTLTLSTNPNP
jgi:hypothetical protein